MLTPESLKNETNKKLTNKQNKLQNTDLTQNEAQSARAESAHKGVN